MPCHIDITIETIVPTMSYRYYYRNYSSQCIMSIFNPSN
uniref:Uncharacterized protein n=1 Tax=Arundo donax TaxID=35708 RepID=A0A0A9AAY8_ARUDO